MSERFVSESIAVRIEDLEPAAVGEPGAPRRFAWRGETIEVARVIDRWRETRGDTHGSAEQYAFKHWFAVETTDGRRMKLYFERKARSKSQAKKRWWLFSVEE